jgi:penicillin-binding protein 2
LKPHLVREVIDVVTSKKAAPVAPSGRPLPPSPRTWRSSAGHGGRDASKARRPRPSRARAYTSGGKTGTAQVVTIAQGEKYNAAQLDERHRDHALYMAYAPPMTRRSPWPMIVENAGFGAANAAPIARRAFDYYLLGLYPSEEDMAAVRARRPTWLA